MNTFTMPHAHIAIESSDLEPSERIAAALRPAIIRIRRAVAAFRMRRELRRLPDWLLRDIDIKRDEIGYEVEARLDETGRSRGGYPF